MASCIEDSFLTKINLDDGSYTSLLGHSDITILEKPIKTCSLSNIDDTIFIGYSKIIDSENQKNVNNIIFKIGITDKNSLTTGPVIDDSVDKKFFPYPESTAFTSSSRHISCEPLRILWNTRDYRLICLHEGIYIYDATNELENMVFATSINSDFNTFEEQMNDCQIKYGYNDLGFRIYRENDTYARCMTSNALVEVYLKSKSSIYYVTNPKKLPTILYSFNSEVDLFSYNNKFRFIVKKC